MLPAFDQLKEKYGGQVYSLTLDFGEHGADPDLLILTMEEYQKLVDMHVMFKDMDVDPVSHLFATMCQYNHSKHGSLFTQMNKNSCSCSISKSLASHLIVHEERL